MTPKCDGCQRPYRQWHDDDGVDMAYCRECDEEVCSKCAWRFDVDVDEPSGERPRVTVFALCGACAKEQGLGRVRCEGYHSKGRCYGDQGHEGKCVNGLGGEWRI